MAFDDDLNSAEEIYMSKAFQAVHCRHTNDFDGRMTSLRPGTSPARSLIRIRQTQSDGLTADQEERIQMFPSLSFDLIVVFLLRDT